VKRWGRRKQALAGLAVLVGAYLVTAYLVVPAIWKRYERRRLGIDDLPRITRTGSDIPGDPLNVALIGTEAEVITLMIKSKWRPADPLTLRSSLKIAVDTVLNRSYDDAPVSNLYLFGRKEDLAFEQPVGNNPRKRHHVRFWRSDVVDAEERLVWIGSATYDERVGLSHTTGQITHHIAADVDAERDHLFQDLQESGYLTEKFIVDGFHQVLSGKNGGGDPWRTDGDLWVGVSRAGK
jgi:hypothetical protein